jgi:hypothetical protein
MPWSAVASILRPAKLLPAVFIALPWLAVAVDFAVFPVLFEGKRDSYDISARALLSARPPSLPMGRYRGHRVKVSLDDVSDPEFLGMQTTRATTLVLSLFVDDASEPKVGELTYAILERLRQRSPDSYDRFVRFLHERGGLAAGQVERFTLSDQDRTDSRFFAQDLIVVTLRAGGPLEEKRRTLRAAMARVYQRLEEGGASAVILPCLGVNFVGRLAREEFGQFFEEALDGLSLDTKPKDVALSLYANWPTNVLPVALAALDAAWRERFERQYQFPMLYRQEIRMTLAFLAVCLFVCSRFVRLSLKNFSIISIAFIGIILGSGTLTAFAGQGLGLLAKLVIQVSVLTFVSCAFPFLTRWNPKSVFGTE